MNFYEKFEEIDNKIIDTMSKFGIPFLRFAIAVIFIWFGILKPLGLSPAQTLVEQTVTWFNPTWFVPFLGWWEVIIGVCFLFRKLIRIGILLLALQMAGTFLPLILLPNVVYNGNFFKLTLEGQYIIKNLVIIGSAMVIGSTVKDK
jgi:uncharacterized membrane protein YkgB